jgi:hypothetical protein
MIEAVLEDLPEATGPEEGVLIPVLDRFYFFPSGR